MAFEAQNNLPQTLVFTQRDPLSKIIQRIKALLEKGQKLKIVVEPDVMPNYSIEVANQYSEYCKRFFGKALDNFTYLLLAFYCSYKKFKTLEEVLVNVTKDGINKRNAEVGKLIDNEFLLDKSVKSNNTTLADLVESADTILEANEQFAGNDGKIIALIKGINDHLSKYSDNIVVEILGVSDVQASQIARTEEGAAIALQSFERKSSEMFRKEGSFGTGGINLELADYPPELPLEKQRPPVGYIEVVDFFKFNPERASSSNIYNFAMFVINTARTYAIKARNAQMQRGEKGVTVVNYIETNYSSDLDQKADPIQSVSRLAKLIANDHEFDSLSNVEIFNKLNVNNFWVKEALINLFLTRYIVRLFALMGNFDEVQMNDISQKLIKILKNEPDIINDIISQSSKRNLVLIMNEKWRILAIKLGINKPVESIENKKKKKG